MQSIDDKSLNGAYDQLTGLLSPESLAVVADQMVARSAREGEELSVICLQMVSSPDGEAKASQDATLVELSWLLRSDLRASDAIGRTGANEISALLPNTGQESVSAIVEHFSCIVAEWRALFEDRGEVQVGCSTFEPSSVQSDLEALLEIARLDISFTNRRWSVEQP